MKQKEAIDKVRELRDDALSIRHLEPVVKEPGLDADLSAKQNRQIVQNCDELLDFWANTSMFYGPNKEIGDLEHLLTPQQAQEKDFGVTVVNEMSLKPANDDKYLLFVNHIGAGEEASQLTHDDAMFDFFRLQHIGSVVEPYTTEETNVTEHPAYLAPYEMAALFTANDVDERTWPDHQWATAVEADESHLAQELYVLKHKQEIQSDVAQLHEARLATLEAMPEEGINIRYQYLYNRLATDPLGSRETRWQLDQMDDLAVACGAPSRKKELDALCEQVPEGKFGPDFSKVPAVMKKLEALREDRLKAIRDKILVKEQAKIQDLASSFRQGKTDSCTAFCCAALTKEGKEFDFAPKPADVAALIKTEAYPVKDILTSIRELAPFANSNELQCRTADYLANSNDSIQKQFHRFREQEFRMTYSFGTTMQKLIQGDARPLQAAIGKYTNLIYDKAIPKMPEKAAKVVEDTVDHFKSSVNKFIAKKFEMSYPER